ncbi:MAG: transglutaminase domain-containing protein [Bacteroidetes bacterium]|nr:transglutaminase domain-containing protein [Bacteroidota bacterium]
MFKLSSLFSLLILAALFSCQRGPHFISDKNYRAKVEAAFEKQKELAKNRSEQLFSVFDQELSRKEKEALKFLYAYMPLSDLADYNGDFYLQNVRASLAAQDTFAWGKTVPENIFRHFVLPIRVNNENLDSGRTVFFLELKDRVKRLSMKDAALEVNHWCHEKVTYRGSDGRTSAPLATIKNAYGRCGEESTFTVAALRSVAIPARQCYTPRWAHSDDNHAWVEVWIDGKWHYLGACEPEPDLDMAWFTGPAKRAMLVNTNVFGDYEGPEDVLVKDSRFTRINVLTNYTDTKKIWVKVIGEKKDPVDSATVEFQLYNYAEFYPLLKTYTDSKGLCSFTTGYGDLLVWAAKKDRFGYSKATISTTDTLVLELDRKPGSTYEEELDFIPPPEKKVEQAVPDSVRAKNSKRFAFEDRLRADYESTFIDSSKAYRLSANLKLNGDTLWNILHRSRGNWRTIIEFVSSVPAEKKSWIFPLLLAISEKDLHDVTVDVLDDNILNSIAYETKAPGNSVFSDYILCPRVDNEFLIPYKEYFQKNFSKDIFKRWKEDPSTIANWINENIRTDENANYSRAPMTPKGVYELKVSDPHSRDIFYVAICRSFGIPARLETATRIPQYYFKDKWTDVHFDKKPGETGARATLVINNDRANDRKPEYYIHFTIEKQENGFFRSLDYETDPVLQSFPCTLQVPPAYYMLVTGNRISGGTVLTRLSFFDLEEKTTREVTLSLRKNLAPPPVLGKIPDGEAFVKKISGADLSMKQKGMIIAWLDPEKEPSRHFIADLIQKKAELEKWNGPVLLLFNSGKEMDLFLQKNAKELPGKTKSMIASAGSTEVFSAIIKQKVGANLPVVTFINPGGEVNYLAEGYRIGIGDDIIRLVNLKK